MNNNETVAAFAERLELKAVNLSSPDRIVGEGYVGDLLSWVMGRAPADGAWVTVMTNVNVIAEAVMAELPCVILTEGVRPDDIALQRARDQEISVLVSDKPTYETCLSIGKVL